MRDSRNALILIAAGAFVAVGATAAVIAYGGDHHGAVQVAEGYSWTGTIGSGGILEIKGVNGPIVVERASGSRIEVTAEADGHRSDPRTVTIERVEHAGGVTFCAMYPTPRGERENSCAPGEGGRMSTDRNDVEVSFHVMLPEGVTFHGRTVNGLVRNR